jgi:hypothetical protein
MTAYTAPIASRAALVAALVASVLLSGCALEIKKPWADGIDPCDPNPCTKNGACENWTGTCKIADDGQNFTCSDWKADATPPNGADGAPLTKPEKFEDNEASCDGVDNDCDGETDEGLVGNPVDDCAGKGLCAGAIVNLACVGGAWKCDYAVLAGYEVSETTCDGKDNDCDGEVDETTSPGPYDCRRAGVCATLPPATCDAGKWNCRYDKAVGYEVVEASCDGADNDCDGKIDTGLSLKSLAGGATCSADGVCAAGVTIACQAGVPTCSFAAVAGWQAAESACDGKDNDCDGKTDNLNGTDVLLTDSKTSSCKADGVCKVAATSVSRTCSAGKWTCNYDAVPYFEVKEGLCDGRDNDCDGTVDGPLAPPKTTPCPTKGVCAAGTSTCNDGLWGCDYGELAKIGYEPFEVKCDGADNDCDGETDETVSAAAHGCKNEGVCAVGVPVSCKAGKANCEYDSVPLFELGSETSCDGKDNDCDGLVDEGALDASQAGCSKGVCAGIAVAHCSTGKWLCDVSKVTGFQAKELSCDGKDNDCDGKTDEIDDLDLSATKCGLSLGVCGTEKKVVCGGAKASCSYGGNYEVKETKCDGKDNDCDGQTDLGMCAAGKPCGADAWCDKGTCADVRGGTGKQCTTKFGQCLNVDSKGKIEAVDSGGALCLSGTSQLSCSAGTFKPVVCPSKTPACHLGKCLPCIPSQNSCDLSKPGDVLQCDAQGAATVKLKTCVTGKCVGAGLCVVKGVIAVSDTSKQITGVSAADIAGGGFVVTWISQEDFGDTVKARAFDGEGNASKTVAKSFDVSDAKSYANPASGLGIASNGDRYAIAWTSGDDVHVRVYTAADQKPAGTFNVVGDKASETTGGSIASLGAGFVVVWSASISGSSDRGIYFQRLDKNGKAIGAATRVLNDVKGRQDTSPAVVDTPDGGFIVIFASTSQFGAVDAGDIYGRVHDKSGNSISKQVTLTSTATKGVEPSIVRSANTVLVAWTAAANAGDVQVATFSTALVVKKAAATVNTLTKGLQKRPRLALAADGGVVMSYESIDLTAGSGADVAVRKLDATGAPISAESVGGGDGKNLQDKPALATFADTRELVVWLHRDTSGGVAKVQAQFR